MANEFMEWVAGAETEGKRKKGVGYSITPGIVTNNCDLLAEGRVLVRIPSLPAIDVFARLSAAGAGSSRGFLWVPEVDDEVLVAFNQEDERDAFLLGGLWSTIERPPLLAPPEFVLKRVIKTGKTGGLGHEVEFDDALQSITITSSTKQKITIDPLTIELKNTAGTLSIKMDNTSQTISITAAAKLELKAPQIKIEGVNVEIKGATINVQAATACQIQGLPVKIN
ncbi:MAG TPA: phage baseplate assembly protein V [Blastocatellia bacterium]|nr:phage baseplate assembly protein V [Blastocatellia bacterium]